MWKGSNFYETHSWIPDAAFSSIYFGMQSAAGGGKALYRKKVRCRKNPHSRYYKGRPQDVSIPVQCYETPPENPVVLFDDAQGAYLFNYVEEELVGTTKTIVVNGKELVGDYRKTSMSWVPAPIVDYFCAGSDEDRYEAVLFSITQLYDELESITFTPNYNCVIDIPIGVEEAREICKAFIRENTDIDLDAYNTDAPPLREPELYPDGMYRETYYFWF